jgi:hypothetical protein
MVLLLLNIRELRSFKIRQNGINLCRTFSLNKQSIAFATSFVFYTDSRIYLEELLSKQNLKTILFSFKVFRLLFIRKEWHSLKNLLRGQLFFIKPNSYNFFSKENLKMLLNSNYFFLRFIWKNEIFYRKNFIYNILEKSWNLINLKRRFFMNFKKIKNNKKYPFLFKFLFLSNFKFNIVV